MNTETEKFIKRVVEMYGDKFSFENTVFVDYRTNVTLTCHKHGSFEKRPDKLMAGIYCRHCKTEERHVKKGKLLNEKVSTTVVCDTHGIQACSSAQVCKLCINEARRKKISLSMVKNGGGKSNFIKKARERHGDLYSYDKVNYIRSKDDVTITCAKHGDFLQKPNDHIQGSGCHLCCDSKGEKQIDDILMNKNLSFLKQKSFPDCIYKGLLRFDHYVPELNLCIEYDGEQHFKPVDFFGGEKTYNDTLARDAVKNSYCEKNGINLLRIKHNKNAEKAIEKMLAKLSAKKENINQVSLYFF